MDEQLLVNYGIDYKKGKINCMGNEVFYKKILSMFLEDKCIWQLEKAFKNKDYKQMFLSAHELKGVSGNAALIKLYQSLCAFVEFLRSGTEDYQTASVMFEATMHAYNEAIKGIAIILAQD